MTGEATAVAPATSAMLLSMAGATFSTGTATLSGSPPRQLDHGDHRPSAPSPPTSCGGRRPPPLAPTVTVSSVLRAGHRPTPRSLAPSRSTSTPSGSTRRLRGQHDGDGQHATIKSAVGANSATVTLVVKDGDAPTPNTIASGITVTLSIGPVGSSTARGVRRQGLLDVFTITRLGIGQLGRHHDPFGHHRRHAAPRGTCRPLTARLLGHHRRSRRLASRLRCLYSNTTARQMQSPSSRRTLPATGRRPATVVATGTVLASPVNGRLSTLNGGLDATATTVGEVDAWCNGTSGSARRREGQRHHVANAITVYCSDVRRQLHRRLRRDRPCAAGGSAPHGHREGRGRPAGRLPRLATSRSS